MTPSILLSTGKYFDYTQIDLRVIELRSIARSLSKQCRWTGHCTRFYSVAEHSVRASWVDPTLETLMHDASEAYCVDVPSPLKQMLPDYKAIEDRVQRAIAVRFGLKYPFPQKTHEADIIMLATEARDLLPPHHPWPYLEGVEVLPDEIPALEWGNPFVTWEQAFLRRYEELRLKG